MGKLYGAIFPNGDKKTYDNWDDCKRDVHGKKSVIFKSFKTKIELDEFFLLNGKKEPSTIKKENIIEETLFPTDEVIFVDGSYKSDSKEYSYGLCVINIKTNEVLHQEYGKGEDEESTTMRNVAGEILGAMKAVEYGIENKKEEISIAYDYFGIEMWAKGTWKRNKKMTQAYHEYMKSQMEKIKINFVKIKGHSNNIGNDLADELAKKALGI